jgi:bifunctional non-homologous end joining protein LigD
MRSIEFAPCLPTRKTSVPAGPDWIHEIKHDGYRMMAWRAGDRIRLLTRSRADWSERFQAVVKALEWLDVNPV